MSGNGSGFSEFKSDDVLPVEKISATSSGDILNSMKSKLVGGKKEKKSSAKKGGKKEKKSSLKKGGKKILGGDEEEEEVPVVEEEFVVEEDSTVPADEELVVEEEFAVRDDKEEFMGGVPKATVMYDPYHIEPRREAIKLDPLVEEQKQKNIAEYEEFMKNNSKGGKKSAKKSKKSKNSKKSVKKFWLF
jgi:hypothetical protein